MTSLELVTGITPVSRRWLPYAPRITNGLQGCYLLGEHLPLRNHAPGGVDLEPVDNPELFPTFARTKGKHYYYNTGISQTTSYTYITVSRAHTIPTNNNPTDGIIIGNYFETSPGDIGTSCLYMMNNDNLMLAMYTGIEEDETFTFVQTALSIDSTEASQWALVVTTVSAEGDELRHETLDMVAFTSVSEPRNLSARPICIGGTESNRQGEVDVAMALVYDRALSQREREAMVSDIRTLMAAEGITV